MAIRIDDLPFLFLENEIPYLKIRYILDLGTFFHSTAQNTVAFGRQKTAETEILKVACSAH